MILAALAVIYINTEETKEQGEQALDQSYQVFSITDDQSAAASLGLSLVNSLIIVCVIGGMTFVLVLLYKYRCVNIFCIKVRHISIEVFHSSLKWNLLTQWQQLGA